MSELNLACEPAPSDKRKYISDLGKLLIADYGKKKYYKPSEVRNAHKKSDWGALHFCCWGMSTYCSRPAFDKYHQQTGETCDYNAMKMEMLQGISLTDSVQLTEIPNVNFDTSWLDLGELFGGVLQGIGDFFSAIADGID